MNLTGHRMRFLNSYFKYFLVLLAGQFFSPASAHAITLSGVYLGTCERDIGVIVNVDENKIQLLTLSGIIKSISRFDIIYLAEYPLGNIPIRTVQNPNAKVVTIVNTLLDSDSRELVRGWPIEFSKQSVLFLTTDGDELIISREAINSVEQQAQDMAITLKNATTKIFNYRYPALFRHCETSRKYRSTDNDIFPQQLIGNPLLIKSHLDQLMHGHKLMGNYVANQSFYPIPTIYNNDTQIGIWYNINSRHGASSSRNNSIIPYIISDYSEGPFQFQRRIITGSYIMPYSTHEEPQTLFSYELKADYFHFSGMFDFSTILIGKNYPWKKSELDPHDDRVTEYFHLAAGFDFGGFSSEVALVNYSIGVRNEEYFANDTAFMYRYRLAFKNHIFESDLYFGLGKNRRQDDSNQTAEDDANTNGKEDNTLELTRFNFAINYLDNYRPYYSLIYRKYDYERKNDHAGNGGFSHESTSFTNFFALDYQFTNDITITVYTSEEDNQIIYNSDRGGIGNDRTRHFKYGSSVRLTF